MPALFYNCLNVKHCCVSSTFSSRNQVIDRGIFGLECFNRFQNDYLITWEKGYEGDGWDDNADTVKFTRYKSKNGKAGKRKKFFLNIKSLYGAK